MEKVFNHFDGDGDGKISLPEFTSAIRSLEPSISTEEVAAMMKEMDADGDGFIDFREFSDFLSGRTDKPGAGAGEADEEEEKVLADAFKTYDINGDGHISVEELRVVLRRLGNDHSLEECTRMIGKFDGNGDGKVDFKEFKNMMASKK